MSRTGNATANGGVANTGYLRIRKLVQVHQAAAPRPPLDVAADALAGAVRGQWEEEAALRRLLEPAPLPLRWQVTRRKVAGRIDGAVAEEGRARFDPLPGLAPVTRDVLRRGGGLPALHAVYGGLPSGRLLLVGEPAVGKTSAAILLLREALRHRAKAAPDERAGIPVPVMLTPFGWDPAEESAADWVAGRLCHQYTLFRSRGGLDRARELLADGRIALFLDGIDEVAGKPRAAMLSALEEADFRVVVVSRARALTGRHQRLSGAAALEIQPVSAEDAGAYLMNLLPDPGPSGWEEFHRRLHEPGSAVAETLTSPLAVSLLRDVYADHADHDGRRVDELLDTARFPDARSLREHLLDQLITTAYTPRPRRPRPRHSPETARRTLRYLAAQVTSTQADRELRWWHIPAWTDPRPRTIAVGAVTGLLYGLVGLFVLWETTGPLWACLLAPLCAVAGAVLAAHRHAELSDQPPLPSAGWRDIFPPRAVALGIFVWLFSGTVSWLALQLPGMHPLPVWLACLAALPLGFGTTLVSSRGYKLVAGTLLGTGSGPGYNELRDRLSRRPVAETQAVGPREVWRHHIGLRLLLGLLTGVAVALFAGLLAAHEYGVEKGALVGALAGLYPFLFAGPVGNLGVATALAALQLSAAEGTPVRLVAFLEDARRRGILRAAGPAYQFRHDWLRARLTGPARSGD
ncbi:hypothetical protein [Streptomyces sp. SID5910]|uniref:hypothetical protein n=1 Tax=Streptomyces sp. SID5910 TaxID=2690312 RepID=UPI00136A019B|nr:hypothetical protein [Streptomyces sp. SID5910]MYR41902.1 hypothetical protein [Streptomyces sp. SID5910]